MRERSKKAARTRREKENHEFAELAKLLPLPGNVTSQLDKASVVKLTTAYLKLRELFPQGLGAPWGSAASDDLLKDLASFLLQALEGFLFIVGTNSKIIYISEGVSFYLGLSQVEMMGNNLNDYIHVSDHDALKVLLNHEETIRIDSRIYEEVEIARSFSLRMKCVLTKRSAGLVTDNYKLIYCRGYLKLRPLRLAAEGVSNPNDVRYTVAGLVAVGNAMHPTSILELKMYSHSFMYRAELDLKFLHLDPKAKDLTGYGPNHLLYKSLYKFVHVRDCIKIREDHKALIAKGQAVTSYYRFLTYNGGWIWMQTSFIVLLNAKSRQTFILAINHVISECEYNQYVFEMEQVTSGEFNFDSSDCFMSEQSEYVSETINKDIPKKRKKKTELSSISPAVMNNSFCPFDTNNRVLQNSNTLLPYAGDFQHTTNIQPRKEANNFPHNIQDQPVNTIEVSINHLQSFTHTQSINADERSTSHFQHITRGQPANTAEASKSSYLPISFNQSANTEKMSAIYFQSNIHNQSINTAELPTSLYQSAKFRQPINRAETSINTFQSFTRSHLPTTVEATASRFQPNTHGQSANTAMSFAYNLQSIAVNNSSSHASDSSINDFKSSWFTSGSVTNTFLPEDMYHVNELPTISAPNISNELHNSFFAKMYPSLIAPMRDGYMGCGSSEYPNLNTNQRAQHAMISTYSEISDAMATESSCKTMCNGGSCKITQNTDGSKSICRNSSNHTTKNEKLEHNSHLQASTSDAKSSEIINDVAQIKSIAITPQTNKATENFKKSEKHVSNFDHREMTAEEEILNFNNIGDLKDESYIPINTYSDTIKNEISCKDQLMDLYPDWSAHKNVALHPLETDVLQTESLNTSYLELTQHWIASNNFNDGYSNIEPLDIRSECASSMSLSIPSIASNEQSPFLENKEFSFSREEIIPNLSNLSNYASGYSDQSSNENSKSYFEVQSSSSTTNRSDSLGLSFFQSSSSTPLYTVL